MASNFIDKSCEYLGILLSTDLSRDDNLFKKGANSLILIKWAAYLKDKFNVDLNLEDVFEFQTVEQVFTYLNSNKIVPMSNRIGENSKQQHDLIPLCSSQEGIWLHDIIYKTSRFTLCGFIEIMGQLNSKSLIDSIREIITINDIFHIRFLEKSKDILFQYYSADIEFDECIQWICAENKYEANICIKNLAETYINLTKEIPYKFYIIHVRNDLNILVILIHHILADEETFEMISRDIVNRYFSANRTSTKKIGFMDYCRLKANQINNNDLIYWQKKLLKNNPYFLQFDKYLHKSEDRSIEFILPQIGICKLKDYCLENRVTLYSGVFSLIIMLLYLLSGKNYIYVCSAVSDRINHKEFIDTYGMFVNNVLLQFDVTYTDSFQTLLSKVNKSIKEGIEHSSIAIDEVLRKSPEINGVYSKLQNYIVFNFVDYERREKIQNNVQFEPLIYASKKNDNAINIYIQNIKGQYVCNISCSNSDIDNSVVEEIKNRLVHFLENQVFLSNYEIINNGTI